MSVCDGCIAADKRMIFVGDHPAPYSGITCRITGKTYAHGYKHIWPFRREGSPQTFPDSCDYAPILKLLVRAKEVDHLYVSKVQGGKGGEWVEFWIRRQR